MTRLRFVPLGGFLGAGKTTTMIRAAQELQARGERVVVVTNDQGEDLVDTATTRRESTVPVGEVTGGCFCCRFDDLADVVDSLIESHRPTVVLAEAVGSCTDLQSTVIRPLRVLRGDDLEVSPLVVLCDPHRYRSLRGLFGPDGADGSDLAHLVHHQLAEADVIALNKVDLLEPAERDELLADLRVRFPGTTLLPVSAATGAGFANLLTVWGQDSPTRSEPFAVDYDRYGAAEAELAWTNQVFDVKGSFVPDDWLDAFLTAVHGQVRSDGSLVGHVKVRVATARGCAKGSLVADGLAPQRDQSDPSTTSRATVLVNARVVTTPARLDDLVRAAAQSADLACASVSACQRGDVFRPGFPVPTHRM